MKSTFVFQDKKTGRNVEIPYAEHVNINDLTSDALVDAYIQVDESNPEAIKVIAVGSPPAGYVRPNDIKPENNPTSSVLLNTIVQSMPSVPEVLKANYERSRSLQDESMVKQMTPKSENLENISRVLKNHYTALRKDLEKIPVPKEPEEIKQENELIYKIIATHFAITKILMDHIHMENGNPVPSKGSNYGDLYSMLDDLYKMAIQRLPDTESNSQR